jgi:2-polyprenyl-3-methyl-5-hydroxy-6-metoxy-1,4-benzoquinol methylase
LCFRRFSPRFRSRRAKGKGLTTGSMAEWFPAPLVRKLAESLSSEANDESAVPSYTHWNPAIRWLMFRRLEVIRQMSLTALARQRARAGVAALDFGCGIGMLIPALAPSVQVLYVCDEQLAPARATAQWFAAENVVCLLPDELTSRIDDSNLDVVVAADVLEHVDNLAAVVEVLWCKLRAGGVLIVSGPTENRAYRLGRRIAGFSGDYHVRSVFDVEDEIRKARFARESLRQLPFYPGLFRITLWRRTNRGAHSG